MQKKCGSVAGTKYKLPFGYRKDYGGLVMKKIFILCALLIVYVCVRCGTGVQLLQTGSEQMAVAQFHGFSGNLF